MSAASPLPRSPVPPPLRLVGDAPPTPGTESVAPGTPPGVLRSLRSDRLSTFRTEHEVPHYGEFETPEQFLELRRQAEAKGLPTYILGNGSNTLFLRRTVRSAVLRNRLRQELRDLGDGRVEVSSSVPIMRVLRHCEQRSLTSFYFLASVPATIGGAIAMNAGLGSGPTILDFVESVTSIEDGREVVRHQHEIERRHRWTIFTGVHDRLITKVVFRFEPTSLEESPIRERIDWARDHQDLAVPNCGSVFRESWGPILRRARALPPWGLRWPGFRAQYSRKVNNWISCRSRSSLPVVILIRAVQLAHLLVGRRARTEIIQVR